ncbi:MAG TPA: DoxX family protein [Candidatus Paceibacterota bacterium]
MPPTLASKWSACAPRLLSVLRIVAALLFIEVGATKLFGFPIPMPGGMTVEIFSLIGLAGILEVFGGALMLLGLFARPAAFILAGEMAVAYFMAHFGNGFWPIANGGTDAILFCFIWLFFSAAGAGVWSLDAARGR